jgi:cyanophycinase-like exopeptidase
MILSKRIPSFRLAGTNAGFGLVPAQFIMPHFDAIPVMFKPLTFALKSQLKKGERMLGVDENTALVGRIGGEWKVMGQGRVHVFTREGSQTYENGQTLLLN